MKISDKERAQEEITNGYDSMVLCSSPVQSSRWSLQPEIEATWTSNIAAERFLQRWTRPCQKSLLPYDLTIVRAGFRQTVWHTTALPEYAFPTLLCKKHRAETWRSTALGARLGVGCGMRRGSGLGDPSGVQNGGNALHEQCLHELSLE